MTASSLRLETRTVPAAAVGGPSPLPLLGGPGVHVARAGDDLTLRANMAAHLPDTLLPYHAQDGYGRELGPARLRTVLLANEALTATFLLDLGGRLWSLIDNRTGRELLHQAEPIQVGNLALRNAWFAGGVEWNLGTTGHWGLTCAPVFAAEVDSGAGFPVLRLWEYERLRGLIWRIDCWLPPGAPALLVRPQLHNPYDEPVPVYWWSNIAVRTEASARVMAPATRAALFGYVDRLHEVDVPVHGDLDVSRPAALPAAADYFFDIAPGQRPWIAAVGPDGAGLAQVSTPPLRGRKLFAWGDSVGGRHWQRWLGGDYVELQAGLARTQLEHLPLAGGATLAWTEAYQPVAVPDADAGWREVGLAVESALVPATDLLAAERQAADWAATAPAGLLHLGSGWGGLQVAAGALPVDPATPFPAEALGDAQQPWLELLRTGALPASEPPAASVVGPGWRGRLAGRDWHSLVHAGRDLLAAGDRAGARAAWRASVADRPTAWALRDLGQLAALDGDVALAADQLLAAHRLRPDVLAITIEALTALAVAGRAEEVLPIVDALPAEQRGHGRIRFAECRAAVETGDLARAEAILRAGLIVADLREGEDSVAVLWERWQAKAGTAEELPPELDFRMFAGPRPDMSTDG